MLVASKGGTTNNDKGSELLSKSSVSKASVNTNNTYSSLDNCNMVCGTTCLSSGSSYVCPTYSCDGAILSGTQCYK